MPPAGVSYAHATTAANIGLKKNGCHDSRMTALAVYFRRHPPCGHFIAARTPPGERRYGRIGFGAATRIVIRIFPRPFTTKLGDCVSVGATAQRALSARARWHTGH
jgi:hypothetical protein